MFGAGSCPLYVQEGERRTEVKTGRDGEGKQALNTNELTHIMHDALPLPPSLTHTHSLTHTCPRAPLHASSSERPPHTREVISASQFTGRRRRNKLIKRGGRRWVWGGGGACGRFFGGYRRRLRLCVRTRRGESRGKREKDEWRQTADVEGDFFFFFFFWCHHFI